MSILLCWGLWYLVLKYMRWMLYHKINGLALCCQISAIKGAVKCYQPFLHSVTLWPGWPCSQCMLIREGLLLLCAFTIQIWLRFLAVLLVTFLLAQQPLIVSRMKSADFAGWVWIYHCQWILTMNTTSDFDSMSELVHFRQCQRALQYTSWTHWDAKPS